MTNATHTPAASADSKFPVLSTRLAEVEPIIRPKVGRKPASFSKSMPTTYKPVAFGTKKSASENPSATESEKPPATSRPRRRALTAPFVLLLALIAAIINFAFTWVLDNKTNLPALMAEKSPIMLGERAISTPAPASTQAVPAVVTPMPQQAGREEVEVIPYHRVYDPALIERLEKQNPPASGTP